MTFDNAGELEKIKNYFPNAKLVIRVAADDSYSVLPLGTKFGAHPSECVSLLQMALDLKLNIVGVRFVFRFFFFFFFLWVSLFS
jgi:ornithine decarboxylase